MIIFFLVLYFISVCIGIVPILKAMFMTRERGISHMLWMVFTPGVNTLWALLVVVFFFAGGWNKL